MNRIREAGRICRAVRALAGHKGRDWPAWARLENTYAVILAETGQLRRGIEQMQRAIPRLEGMYRKVSEAALVRMLMLAGVIGVRDGEGVGPHTDAKASHFLATAIWNLDADELAFALKYAARPNLDHVWGEGLYHVMGRHMARQLENPKRTAAREFEQEFRKVVTDADAEMLPFTLAQARCEFNRIAGQKQSAVKDLKEAEQERQRMLPDITPGPLELATHYRNALILMPEDDPLHQRARRHFKKRLRQGYLLYEGTLDDPAGIPRKH
jgi:hypothetical protein